jgi:hypothetical protein
MKFHGAPVTFLQDALYVWLQHQHQCTVSTLCAALRSDIVDEVVLSHDVESRLRARRGTCQ